MRFLGLRKDNCLKRSISERSVVVIATSEYSTSGFRTEYFSATARARPVVLPYRKQAVAGRQDGPECSTVLHPFRVLADNLVFVLRINTQKTNINGF